MDLTVSFQVPVDDTRSLLELAGQLGQEVRPIELHPFDGETVSEVVFVITAVGIPTLKLWLDSRVKMRERWRVVHNGIEYEGYTAREVEKLMQALQDDVTA